MDFFFFIWLKWSAYSCTGQKPALKNRHRINDCVKFAVYFSGQCKNRSSAKWEMSACFWTDYLYAVFLPKIIKIRQCSTATPDWLFFLTHGADTVSGMCTPKKVDRLNKPLIEWLDWSIEWPSHWWTDGSTHRLKKPIQQSWIKIHGVGYLLTTKTETLKRRQSIHAR